MSETETASMGLPEIHDWVFSELGFCGCGDPEAALELFKSVLLAIRKRSHENREIEESDAESMERWRRNSAAINELVGMERAPAMAWFFLYMLSDKDLLEHGGNCSGSWLTERGRKAPTDRHCDPATKVKDEIDRGLREWFEPQT